MATLTKDQKRFILEGLACFDAPSYVRDELRKNFGVDVGLDQIAYYDPTNRRGKELAAKWTDYFFEVRKAFVEETSEIPIALRAYRLRMLDKMCRDAFARKAYGLAASLLEQAAKEMGGAYLNRHHVDLTSGGEKITGVVFTAPGQAAPLPELSVN